MSRKGTGHRFELNVSGPAVWEHVSMRMHGGSRTVHLDLGHGARVAGRTVFEVLLSVDTVYFNGEGDQLTISGSLWTADRHQIRLDQDGATLVLRQFHPGQTTIFGSLQFVAIQA